MPWKAPIVYLHCMNTCSRCRLFLAFLILSGSFSAAAQVPARVPPQVPAFTVIPLGVRGGLDESNLSSYMVAAAGSSDYICLDAGTLYSGIRKAIDDQGEKPQLKKYHYVTMAPGKEMAAHRTSLHVQAFSLSHGNPYESTAFLVRNGDDYLLYFGDTGADSVEHSDKLRKVWEAVSPLIRNRRLKAIFIEVSFPNEQPVRSLFGHLTPALLEQELHSLASLTGDTPLKGLPLVITHRKPSGNQEERIHRQLLAANPYQVKLIFPEQGRRLDF
jgi:hypothetical protein